jgi:glutathione synthase/RimK-type ligase-like ATP-grasp enzyme
MMSSQIDLFDVLVVYSHEIATSASNIQADSNFPFAIDSGRAHYNNAYAYFLESCARQNLRAALTTSADITGAGVCKSYWIYDKKHWIKMVGSCQSEVIFDKFSPSNSYLTQCRRTLFSDSSVVPFNDPYLFSIFFDKLKSFKKFSHTSIPTEAIAHSNIESINKSLHDLNVQIAQHDQPNDFGKGVVLKDRYGSGGFKIYKVDKDIGASIYKIMYEDTKTSYIIQPFTLFDHGYQYKGSTCSIDIRLIFMGKEIIQTYIRMADKNDFRCNEHQGGSLTYINPKDVPQKVTRFAQVIADKLDKPHSLFALDFIVSNNGNVYFLEGNCGPGIDWNLALPKNEKMSKKLIRTIVTELSKRAAQAARKQRSVNQPDTLRLPPVFLHGNYDLSILPL